MYSRGQSIPAKKDFETFGLLIEKQLEKKTELNRQVVKSLRSLINDKEATHSMIENAIKCLGMLRHYEERTIEVLLKALKETDDLSVDIKEAAVESLYKILQREKEDNKIE